jgi:hypothetical protein
MQAVMKAATAILDPTGGGNQFKGHKELRTDLMILLRREVNR